MHKNVYLNDETNNFVINHSDLEKFKTPPQAAYPPESDNNMKKSVNTQDLPNTANFLQFFPGNNNNNNNDKNDLSEQEEEVRDDAEVNTQSENSENSEGQDEDSDDNNSCSLIRKDN